MRSKMFNLSLHYSIHHCWPMFRRNVRGLGWYMTSVFRRTRWKPTSSSEAPYKITSSSLILWFCRVGEWSTSAWSCCLARGESLAQQHKHRWFISLARGHQSPWTFLNSSNTLNHNTISTTKAQELHAKKTVFICPHTITTFALMDTDIFSHDKWQFAAARSGSKSCCLALFEAGDEILRQNRGFGGLCRQTVAGATHE